MRNKEDQVMIVNIWIEKDSIDEASNHSFSNITVSVRIVKGLSGLYWLTQIWETVKIISTQVCLF